MGFKSAIRSAVRKTGFDVVRHDQTVASRVPGDERYIPELTAACNQIPGMVNARQGEALYWMAYTSEIDGDIIEIGSWQGRSTCYLAAACRDAGRGRVHAIDHFQGNPGTEDFYVVDRDDLSDLRSNFERNVARLGLAGWVVLHDGRSHEVVDDVRAACESARLLFIDGDHSYEGVSRDLELYVPMLAPGGVLVLDDYSRDVPGLVKAVREFLTARDDFCAPVQSVRTLVARRRLS